MALNFAIQELRIYYNNNYELRLSKGKKRMVLQLSLYNYYYYCNYIVPFLILVACQAIKPQHIVGLFSLYCHWPTGRLPIFSSEFFVFTDPFLSVLGMHVSAVISDAVFSYSEGKISHIIIPACET